MDEKAPLKTLRTYQGDIAETLAQKNLAMSSIAIAEEKRREKTEPEYIRPKKNNIYVLASVGLVILGVVSVSFVYYFYKKSNTPVAVNVTPKPLIPFTKEISIPFTKDTTRKQLVDALDKNIQSFKGEINSVLYINISETDAAIIWNTLAPNMPGSLLRSLGKLYMFGTYTYPGSTPFIVLTTDDYGQSFAGMLSWEKTMPFDLGEIFAVTAGTSTPNWMDESLHNKDLRVYRDTQGNIMLLYSFIDSHTILITNNENVFVALLSKYTVGATMNR